MPAGVRAVVPERPVEGVVHAGRVVRRDRHDGSVRRHERHVQVVAVGVREQRVEVQVDEERLHAGHVDRRRDDALIDHGDRRRIRERRRARRDRLRQRRDRERPAVQRAGVAGGVVGHAQRPGAVRVLADEGAERLLGRERRDDDVVRVDLVRHHPVVRVVGDLAAGIRTVVPDGSVEDVRVRAAVVGRERDDGARRRRDGHVQVLAALVLEERRHVDVEQVRIQAAHDDRRRREAVVGSGVEAAFWNTCGVPVHATGTVVVVDDDVDVLVDDDEVELDVEELVELEVDDDVDVEEVELVDVELDVVELVEVDDVLVVVEWLVEVDVDDDVLVVLGFDVDEEVDVELDVVELDVLVDELVVVDVVVAKSQPMSDMRSRASDGSLMAVVYTGSMSSFGVSAVSQCDTDEPGWSVVGAYICTWPLATWRPAVRKVAAATTLLPVQWRSVLSIADAMRCASVMFGHVSPKLWSSRNFMNTSSRLLKRVPVVSSTKVWKPRPWPSSCSTTVTKSSCVAPGLLSRP